jgi:hypothetical protein
MKLDQMKKSRFYRPHSAFAWIVKRLKQAGNWQQFFRCFHNHLIAAARHRALAKICLLRYCFVILLSSVGWRLRHSHNARDHIISIPRLTHIPCKDDE